MSRKNRYTAMIEIERATVYLKNVKALELTMIFPLMLIARRMMRRRYTRYTSPAAATPAQPPEDPRRDWPVAAWMHGKMYIYVCTCKCQPIAQSSRAIELF
jgi:hypothetical protein